MPYLTRILKVRYIQLVRFCKDIGWFYFIILLVLLFSLVLIVINGILSNPIKYLDLYLVSVVLILLNYLHTVRKDREFITLTFPNSYTIFCMEYLLLSIPVLLLFSYLEWVNVIIILIGGLFLIPLYKGGRFSLSIKVLNLWIPYKNYEWTAGIRKFVLMIFLLLAAGLLLSYYNFLSLICVGVFLLLTPAYYEKFEPFIFIESTKLTPRKYLVEKIKLHVATYLIFSTPILLVYLIFHPDHYLIVIFFLLLSIFALIFLIISKYTFYSPNNESSKHKLLTNITLLGIFPFIFLLPVVVLIASYLYPRSLKNLGNYLND